MSQEKIIAGFIGAGGIARAHAYCLDSLPYYYENIPGIELRMVCSAREESRQVFMKKYGFIKAAVLDEFLADENIDTVFILGPNKVHFPHLRAVLGMKNIKRIYLEKPVCSGKDEEEAVRELAEKHGNVKIQVGFQYLFSPSVREALSLWQTGVLGKPLHFNIQYFHGDYLRKAYREKRQNRLTPAPDGGAMADLGSHAVSMMLAFLGERLIITGALQGGRFTDVDNRSDLFSSISLIDPLSGTAGTLSASRIASGTGDSLSFEIYCEKGSIRYSSVTPDYFEY
ncbi:MAG TPA: Gfo/Idh/MocA family oxidoreductase, partial [Bacteroidales bacterium]|nr:Gfo/Idh/MocA family oxidoreductase [Bacteroidales bacterium]